MKKIVFATNNNNKLEEVRAMIPSMEILGLKDINCTEDIPETEETLEGNAQLKADYVTNNFGFDCFADDTGLEVDALNGAPGVYSARYAGEPANAENNMQKLLSALGDNELRSAQFRTAIALNINEEKHLFEGKSKGHITTEKKGKKGFGYDPIFIPDGFQKSFAEMTMEEKSKISHRGKAVEKLVSFLNSLA